MAFAFDVNCDTIRGCSCYGSLLWVESSMGWGCDREPETLLTASWCLYNFYIEFKIKQQSECGERHIWLILIAILDASCHTCCLHGFQTEVLGNTRYQKRTSDAFFQGSLERWCELRWLDKLLRWQISEAFCQGAPIPGWWTGTSCRMYRPKYST